MKKLIVVASACLVVALASSFSQSGTMDNAAGEKIFKEYCIACHQESGAGIPGMYPPVSQSDWVKGEKPRLIKALLHGLEDEIYVNGVSYFNAMPPYAFLNDEQIAAVLTYIRTDTKFGNGADAITAEEVKRLR